MFLRCFIKSHLEIVFITWHTLYWFWFRKSGSFVGCIFFTYKSLLTPSLDSSVLLEADPWGCISRDTFWWASIGLG